MDERQKKILASLERSCARCEYSEKDVMAKAVRSLSKTGEVTDRDELSREAAEIVSALVSESYVDNLRYACAFAREKASLTGWGPAKIRLALQAKGISGEHIKEALGEIDSARASEKLLKLIVAKRRSLKGDPQIRLKLLRFGLGRGYGYDEVEKAVEESAQAI
ncbi:MAG: RecX family transcriptional regulator [Bacteroidales bacterium]|nr:RecX family transcriptional regulator [Bacteroidales bacterium]